MQLNVDDCELAEDPSEEWGVYGDDAFPDLDLGAYSHVVRDGVRLAQTPELGIRGFHVFGPRPEPR